MPTNLDFVEPLLLTTALTAASNNDAQYLMHPIH